MIDIASIFKNKRFDTEKLLAYGFSASERGFEKDFPILQGQFLVTVSVAGDGAVDFRVYDRENAEEYMPAHVYNASGAFIGRIHKECETILKDLSAACCFTEYFKWQQSKRILQVVRERYRAEPEFLWSSLPECAALRVPGKKPWFAVIGRVPGEKFILGEPGIVEVINLKDEPEAVTARLRVQKAFPAYHMNKRNWYSLILDDREPDDGVLALIEKSYTLVNEK